MVAIEFIVINLISWFLGPHLNQFVKEVFDKLTEDTKDKLTKLQTVMLPRLELMIQTEQMTDNDNNTLSQLMKEFVDVAYEFEEAVDKEEYKDLEQQSKGKVWKLVSSVNPSLISKWKMSNTLKKLEEKVSSIYDFCQRLPQRASNSGDAASITNLSDIQIQPKEILGRDTYVENIVNELTGTAMPNKLKVVVIIGVGGVGKTELAKCIYKRINVSHKEWLSFRPGKFDEVKMTSCTAGLSEDGGFISKTLELVGNKLWTNVSKKKFLLVLDGIWYDEKLTLFENRERWSRLCAPLQNCARGGMILVTTRMQIVAKLFELHEKPTCYFLKGLEHQHCSSIFNKQAFGDAGPDQRASNANLPMIASKIITKIINNLEGIPLAATEAGEKLSNNYDQEDWHSIKRNIIQEDTRKSLMWSYKMLPCHLQQCIRHFTLYPQGFKFNVNFLVLSWIAAGVITHQQRSQNDPERTLEDLGRRYLNDLASRSFLQETEDNLFVLHPALHAISDIITMGECIRITGDERQEIPSTIKHLSIEVNSLDRYENEISKLEKLRTLFLTCNNANSCSVQGGYRVVLKRILKNMKRLRVLRIACCSINKLPDSVGRSKHLRLLDLSNSSFNQLPESVCRVYHLCYLNLSNCNLNTVPKDLKKLIKLQYLVFNGATRSLIPHIDRLTLLREPKEFHVKKRGNGMDNLQGTLRIINLEAVGDASDADEAMLNRETPLKKFVSEWPMPETDDAIVQPEQVLDILQPHDDITSLTVKGYTGAQTPRWMTNRNSKLEALELDNCPNWGTLPELGNVYTYLKKLVLSGCCIDDATLASCLNNLTSLSCLELSRCSHITSLPSVEVFGPLVNLNVLRVMDCLLLTSVGGILALPFLQEFNISGINLQGIAVGAVALLPKSLIDLKITDCGISDNYLSSCLMGLNNLIRLELHQCAHVTTLPSEEVMRDLTSLESVIVHGCDYLESVGGLQALAPTDGPGLLRKLSIQECDRLPRPLHPNLEHLMQAN